MKRKKVTHSAAERKKFLETYHISPAVKGLYKKDENEDTLIRKNIHQTIMDAIMEGKKRKEILELLNSKFNGEEYKKYTGYFEQWVDNRLGNER